MNRPIAILTADWHVRKHDRIWSRRAEIFGDTAFGMAQVLQLAEKHSVPYIIIAGDVLEDKLQTSDATFAMRQFLDKADQSNRHVLYVQGQHERSTPTWLHALHAAPIHIHREVYRVGPIVFYGLDYCDTSTVEEALGAIDAEANVLITHQVWREVMGDDRGLVSLNRVPDHVKLTVSGDFHKALYKPYGADAHFMSPGPLCMQDIAEHGPKSVFALCENLSVELWPLKHRNYYAFDATGGRLDELLDTWANCAARMPQAFVPPHIARNIVRVHYDITDPTAKEKIERKLKPDVHLFLAPIKPEMHSVRAEQEQRRAAVLSGGLRGCIDRFYAEPKDVHDTAVRLEASRNLDEELTTIFRELVTQWA